jgi:hypothetical protein
MQMEILMKKKPNSVLLFHLIVILAPLFPQQEN